MSSCSIIGFFELTQGRRVRTDVKRADRTTIGIWHVYYSTAVICSEAVSLPAEIRKYSPANEVALPEKTVAFVVAKVSVPAGNGPGNVLLEAWHIAPVPGDPGSDGYDERPPDFCRPLVFALGTVAAGHDGPPHGAATFLVSVSDYVRGSVKETTVRCTLDRATPRWRNVPPPNRGALVQLIGRCSEPTARGLLCVDIESIIFCSTPSSPSLAESPITDQGSGKRRKFGPRGAPLAAITNKTTAPAHVSLAGHSVDSVPPTTSQPNRASTSSLTLQGLSALDNELRNTDFTFTAPLTIPPAVMSYETPAASQAEDLSNIDDSAPSTRSKGKRKAQL